MMPAPVVNGDGGESVRTAMLAYRSYGFSVIPILPGTKRPFGLLLPDGKWQPFQKRLATEDEINRWVDERPDIGIGVICGKVSGGLYCLDVDDPDFSLWLENHEPVQFTWIVRTGSGKLHVWLRAEESTLTTVMIGAGRKLADIRGDGHDNHGPSYIVVPPTIHPLTSRPYETLYGSPEFIRSVLDARKVFDRLRDAYLTIVSAQPEPESEPDLDDELFRDYKEPVAATVSDDVQAQHRSRVQGDAKISRRVKKAILEGAAPGDSGFVNAPTQSEIDFAVVRELMHSGWTPDEIDTLFQWSPLGELRYRTNRGSRGRSYIDYAIANVKKEGMATDTAVAAVQGDNFKVIKVVRIGYEEPLYEVTIQITKPSDHTGRAIMQVDDLMDEHRFKRVCMKSCNFLPTIPDTLLGRKFERFGAAMLTMAEEEHVPERATTGGHLRATIRAFIDDEARLEAPEDHRMVTLGWRVNGRVYVRGGALLQRLQAVIRPAPKPEDAWTILRALGGEETGHAWPSGKHETVWSLPTRRVVED